MTTEKLIHWNNYEGHTTEAINFMKFQTWLENASVGDTITYIHNASPKDLGMLFISQTKGVAYKAFCRGDVALFQRRVHPNYPGFDYIAVKLSRRAAEFIKSIQDEPLCKIRERLCA